MSSLPHLVWLDMEMSGLDPEFDRILEMAFVITDGDLNTLAQGPVWTVHQSDELLNGMDDWNQKHHKQSGLIERVRASQLNEQEAQQQVLEFLGQYLPAKQSPLCGNSVWQDRRFLARYMPRLDAFFHYRLVDVSTIKELAKRWQPALYQGFKKQNQHQALADILESIEELRYYKQNWFKSDQS